MCILQLREEDRLDRTELLSVKKTFLSQLRVRINQARNFCNCIIFQQSMPEVPIHSTEQVTKFVRDYRAKVLSTKAEDKK